VAVKNLGVILVADPLIRTWIGWAAGINEIGTADGQKGLASSQPFW